MEGTVTEEWVGREMEDGGVAWNEKKSESVIKLVNLPTEFETFKLFLGRVFKELFFKLTFFNLERPRNVPDSISVILFLSRLISSNDS